MATSTIDAVGSSAMVTVPLTVSKRPRTRPTTRLLGAEADEGVHGVDLVDTSLGTSVWLTTGLWSQGLGHTPS